MLERDLIRKCAENYGADAAYHDANGSRTWKEIDFRSDCLVQALNALGCTKGGRTAILSENRIEVAEHWFACLKSGIVRVGVNWRYSPHEVLHVIRDSDARIIFVEDKWLSLISNFVEELTSEGRTLVGIGGVNTLLYNYEPLIRDHEKGLVWPELSARDTAMIGYTSGSTGSPKGVVLSHGAIYNMLVHHVLRMEYNRSDVRIYVTNPAGININTMCSNIVNAIPTVISNYDRESFPKLVERYGVTQVTLVPTMLHRLLEEVDRCDADLSSLRQVAYGSMPATPALIRKAFAKLGCRLVNAYGASESAGPVVLLDALDHEKAMNGKPELLKSAGKAQPGVQIEIRDENDAPLPTGEMGLVWMSGETIMDGYNNLPELTSETLRDGWLKTGDFGFLDENGYLYLGERKQNMIVSGGFNVYPNAVENVIANHPAVEEVAVIGIFHPEWGEVIVAAITISSEQHEFDMNGLVTFCRDNLARYAVPKHFEVLDALPRGNTDKIDKITLKTILAKKIGLELEREY